MQNRTRIAAILSGLLALAWLISSLDLGLLRVRWNDVQHVPFRVKSQLEIAASGIPWKRRSLSLLCADDGTHLMAKGRSTLPTWEREEYRDAIAKTRLTEIIFDISKFEDGIQIRSFQTQSAIVDFDTVDTVVSAPLNRPSRAALLDWYRRGAPQKLSFMRDNADLPGLEAVADQKAVANFFRSCAASS